ncbi:Alpha/Beta hydrolase protein [Mycena latifolia]|nr:Alpha/Beta hydrolase protein [Mycena latifolia]
MPDVTLQTPTGTVVFNYVIATPTQAYAPNIDPALPTILFLHPVYVGKIIYHQQFADQYLRRFNLIGLDLRCHGRTMGRAGKGYGREVAARDVALFMSTLQIPKYHLFGMSMGGCIALQTGMLFPERVLSIFVVSSLPLTEPPDVGDGRQEIYDHWAEGVRNGEAFESSSMSLAITGCLQLSVNNNPSPIFSAMLRASVSFMTSQWGSDRLDDFHAVSVELFTLRKAYTVDAMRNIACPVYLLHCGADIAYDISTTEQVADHLRTAGVTVEVGQILDAPHFGAITHPKEVNSLVHNFVLSTSSEAPPPVPEEVESPFKEQLTTVGWDSDSDSDREFFI